MHNFKYALKTLFKSKALIFWTYAFPIILGFLFNMAFSGIEEGLELPIIDIAVIKTEKFNSNEFYKNALDTLSNPKDENRLFNIKYVEEDKAQELLDNKEIEGIIKLDKKNVLKTNENGYEETIIKYVFEELIQNEDVVKNLVDGKVQKLSQEVEFKNQEEVIANIYMECIELASKNLNNKNTKNISNDKLSMTMIEYYSLIAMACMYGAILSSSAINKNLANMTNTGKRIQVSPTKKSSIVLTSALASYVVQLIGLFLLFMFTIFVIDVDYGANLGLVILLACVGSFAGLSLGIFISSMFKTKEDNKTGMIIGYTMLGSFLAGMMGISMKYIVDKNVPIVNKLNPVSMITDGFYSLYAYTDLSRYWFDLSSLLIFSCILLVISIFGLRGQKYDNI